MIRTLIIDDVQLARERLKRCLADEPEVEIVGECDNGTRAVETIRALSPDLILMDLGLPGVDGWEATRQLKADAATRHVPIIVLSAHAMANQRELALAAGGDAFDPKPVCFESLLGKIERLLAKAL